MCKPQIIDVVFKCKCFIIISSLAIISNLTKTTDLSFYNCGSPNYHRIRLILTFQ